MNLSKSIFVLPLFFFSFNAKAEDLKSYQYFVRVPGTLLSCQEEASRLANRFSSATKLEVSSFECRGVVDAVLDGMSRQLYDLSINYMAKRPVAVYAANFNPYDLSFAAKLVGYSYDTYAQCLGDLVQQSQSYEQDTGLLAVSAFCEPASYTGYILRVHGFGVPKKRLQYFEFNDDDQLEDVYLNQAREMLTQQGADIVLQKLNGFYYYTDKSVMLYQTWLGLFTENINECTAQVQDVENSLKKSGLQYYTVQCMKNSWLEILSNVRLLESRQSTNPAFYYSFQECMADKARVYEENSKYYNNLLVGICHSDPMSSGAKKYVLDLWYKDY